MRHQCVTLFPLVLLLACSGSGTDPRTPESGDPEMDGAESVASAEPGPPADETPKERTIRLAKAKRQQCDIIADTIQAEPEVDIIANINDGPTLEKLADGVGGAAKTLEGIQVTVKPLLELRDKYVSLLRGKATALGDAAATSADDKKKAALQSYQEHASQVGGVIDEINQFCASPIVE
jgi:hypothetical protein